MKILYIHNEYARPSGEEHASKEIVNLLIENGHEVRWFTRSSAEIKTPVSAFKSFFTGIYNPTSAKKLAKVLDEFKPDIVQVQNLYPFISVSIFKELKRRKIPVVMRCPNYRLFCPNGLSLDNDGKVCEKCWGKGKEWWCVRKNCEKNFFKSLGYAVRNAFARKSRSIHDGVDVFIVQSEFQKQKFISQGIEEQRIAIVPGIVPSIKTKETDSELGEWVTFVGRVSTEKGIDEFIEAAKLCPEIPFKVAGNIDSSYNIPDNLPDNIEFVGFKTGEDLNDLYRNSRIIVVPSKWYEGFPNVIVRAMLLKRPVITTNIGAMQSIIDHEENGILVEPANSIALGMSIKNLWSDIELCKNYGEKGFLKAESQYSHNQIYQDIMLAYNNAIHINKSE